jgi:hypothetical protein
MMVSLRSSTVCRFAGAMAAVWLFGVGAAWAGDSGSDAGTLKNTLGTLCTFLKMASCPSPLPTVTQYILEVAGLENSPPETIAAQYGITPAGTNVYAGNPAAVPPNPFPVTSTALFSPANGTTPATGLLSTLTPLAFISSGQAQGTAAVTQYNSDANVFLYVVGVSIADESSSEGLTVPDTAYFFYDDLSRNNKNFNKGQIYAKFSYPLTVLNTNGTENPPAPITLEVIATCNGGPSCLQAQVISGFGASASKPIMASQFGIQFALVFNTSPAEPNQSHAIFEVAVPLLVTGACPSTLLTNESAKNRVCSQYSSTGPNTDPAYFWTLLTEDPGPFNAGASMTVGSTTTIVGGIYTAFGTLGDDLGVTPASGSGIMLPAGGSSIGLAPTAGPLGPAPPSGTSSTFALCADLPDNSNGAGPHPAQIWPSVGAYYAIGADGEAFVSAALPLFSTSVCPAL